VEQQSTEKHFDEKDEELYEARWSNVFQCRKMSPLQDMKLHASGFMGSLMRQSSGGGSDLDVTK